MSPLVRYRLQIQSEQRPDSSVAAAYLQSVIVAAIVVSSLTFCLETMPELSHYHRVWGHLEVAFVVIFTFELAVRFLATEKSTADFFRDGWTVLDLLALLPFYCAALEFEFPVPAVDNRFDPKTGRFEDTAPPPDMRILRMFRLIRVFKLTRHSKSLQFIFEGLARSRVSFLLLGVMLLLALVFFSFLLFVFERGAWDERAGCFRRADEVHYSGCSPFQDVFCSFWWGITTVTTVGYGDAFPLSVGGRLVASFAMITGLLCVALPTTQLGMEFSEAYARGLREKEAQKAKRSMVKCSREEIMLIDEMRRVERVRNSFVKEQYPVLKALLSAGVGSSKSPSMMTTPRVDEVDDDVEASPSGILNSVPLIGGVASLTTTATTGLISAASTAAVTASAAPSTFLHEISDTITGEQTQTLTEKQLKRMEKRKALKERRLLAEKNMDQLLRQVDLSLNRYRHFLLTNVSKGALKGESVYNEGE
eukprot:g13265.t1